MQIHENTFHDFQRPAAGGWTATASKLADTISPIFSSWKKFNLPITSRLFPF